MRLRRRRVLRGRPIWLFLVSCQSWVRNGLRAGGSRIRTFGPTYAQQRFGRLPRSTKASTRSLSPHVTVATKHPETLTSPPAGQNPSSAISLLHQHVHVEGPEHLVLPPPRTVGIFGHLPAGEPDRESAGVQCPNPQPPLLLRPRPAPPLSPAPAPLP